MEDGTQDEPDQTAQADQARYAATIRALCTAAGVDVEQVRADLIDLAATDGPEIQSARASEIVVVDDVIKPGKPTQNSFVERFNRTYRQEVPDSYIFLRRLIRFEPLVLSG